ncbi:MAG: DNA polymerase III subunit beta [Gammaproteobacteria bacterium]
MDFTIARNKLLKPLQLISSVVETKTSMPVISNLLFELNDQELRITGTDLEVELVKTISLEQAYPEAKALIPAKKLNEICRSLPEGAELHFSRENNQMILRSGKSRFVLTLLALDDFPAVECSDSVKHTLKMPASTLKQLFEKTHFAMAQQDVRYFLNGLLLDFSDATCTAVSTDGHRLALSSVDLPEAVQERHQALIPRKAVLESLKLLTADEDFEITLEMGDHHIRILADNFTFTSKLIDAKFPEYSPLIPKTSNKWATVDKQSLKGALTRVAILSNDKFRGTWLAFDKGTLLLNAHNPDRDEAEDELSIDYAHEPLKIGFNVNYLLDVLNVLDTEQIKIMLTDTKSSILVTADEREQQQYIIMPMSL